MPVKRNTVSSIGIMGFGAFGRLMARHLQPHFSLSVLDPNEPAISDRLGRGTMATDIRGIAACEIIILAVPVDQISAAIAALRPHLRPGAIIIDVGSVKLEPARVMLAELPDDVEIIGTHPLFGPQSAANGIRGLKIAICPIRGGSARRIAAFLRRALGLAVIFTTPDAHDREVALVQGLTHLIGKILVRMEPLPCRMTTKSFELLVQATEMVRHDAPGVFLAIERANPHSAAVRERFLAHAEEITEALQHGHRLSLPAGGPAIPRTSKLERPAHDAVGGEAERGSCVATA